MLCIIWYEVSCINPCILSWSPEIVMHYKYMHCENVDCRSFTYNKVMWLVCDTSQNRKYMFIKTKSKSKTDPSTDFSTYVLWDLFRIDWYSKNHTYFDICPKIKDEVSKIRSHRVCCLGGQQSNHEISLSNTGRKSWKIMENIDYAYAFSPAKAMLYALWLNYAFFSKISCPPWWWTKKGMTF